MKINRRDRVYKTLSLFIYGQGNAYNLVYFSAFGCVSSWVKMKTLSIFCIFAVSSYILKKWADIDENIHKGGLG